MSASGNRHHRLLRAAEGLLNASIDSDWNRYGIWTRSQYIEHFCHYHADEWEVPAEDLLNLTLNLLEHDEAAAAEH